MQTDEYIEIKGLRVNNLKGIDLRIPRDQFIVVTGVSGSGKSSLAFDTLYAEGQRRYVESLSTYARQFLGRMKRPDCTYIRGVPPAIAIEQKTVSRNPRSTVATSTEIYDYLRMLFARVGHTYSPVSGREVKRHSVEDVTDWMLSQQEGSRLMVLSPIILREGRTLEQQLSIYAQEGFSRIYIIKGKEKQGEGRVAFIDDPLEGVSAEEVLLVVDRMVVRHDAATIARLTESSTTAFFEGEGSMAVKVNAAIERAQSNSFELPSGSSVAEGKSEELRVKSEGLRGKSEEPLLWFSNRFEADGIVFAEPSDQLFSFNSPAGACPACEGFGRIIGIDEDLVIPDKSLSVAENAVVCWRGPQLGEWRKEFLRRAERQGFPAFTPYYQLTQEQHDMLWHGLPGDDPELCIDGFFDYVKRSQYKVQYRVMLARYRGKTLCPECHGSRLRKEAGYVQVGGRTIMEILRMSVREASDFFHTLSLDAHDTQVASRLLTELRTRLDYLCKVGLGYLTLDRASNTLSGGESQRVQLSTSIGSTLVGSMYILDEPSIGLHPRDTQQLISVLRSLQQLGNTVVVVEHDEEIMRAADYLIDLGPDAGRLGGEVVLTTTMPVPAEVEAPRSHTLRYLRGEEQIPVPSSRRPWNNRLIVRGAMANNLKDIDVTIPLNVLTVVTGVSGSGKSSLVSGILWPALKRHFDEVAPRPGQHKALEGDVEMIQRVEFVDQHPIGTSTRSNPVTYIGAYDDIRRLMAQQPLARRLGFTPVHFSFNQDGGRCEECKGEGTVTVEMQFMNDLVLPCESCHGQRFKQDILQVRFHDQNINDLLSMTVNQAVEFFTAHGEGQIAERMKVLQDVGLGYLQLGQSSSTLSGGENQRVKLAHFLSQEKPQPTLFIFDEPTTGLHFHDIRRLLEAFQQLICRGHSVLIIEHNMEVIKQADYIIDLGPEGGEAGGYLVACGTPEQVAQCPNSYTGKYLKHYLRI